MYLLIFILLLIDCFLLFFPTRLASVDGNVVLKLVFHNSTDRPYRAEGARIYMEENGHWVPTSAAMTDVPAFSEGSVQLRLLARKGVASAATLPSVIKLSLCRGRTRLIDIACPMAGHWLGNFTGGLRHFGPAKDDGWLNIAVIGVTGAGVSAMINTFLTLLSRGTSKNKSYLI
jgi:hypothetical protein